MAVPRSMAYSSFAMTGEVIRTGVVLSGGGARGAFEAGVMQGVMEVLGTSCGVLEVSWSI